VVRWWWLAPDGVKVEKKKSTALNSFYESIEVMFPIVFVKKKKEKFWAYL
jgi:hypothetical protein